MAPAYAPNALVLCVCAELFKLMSSRCGKGGIDFTLTFRGLLDAVAVGDPTGSATGDVNGDATGGVSSDTTGEKSGDANGSAGGLDDPYLAFVARAALEDMSKWPTDHVEEWAAWARRYGARVAADALDAGERREMMRLANPKYILRNSMAAEAYEAAARGDYSIVNELHTLLSKPYDDQGAEADERWAQLTPIWARDRPGLAYLS